MTLVQTEACGCRLELWENGYCAWLAIECGERKHYYPDHHRPSWRHHPLPWAAVPAVG